MSSRHPIVREAYGGWGGSSHQNERPTSRAPRARSSFGWGRVEAGGLRGRSRTHES